MYVEEGEFILTTALFKEEQVEILNKEINTTMHKIGELRFHAQFFNTHPHKEEWMAKQPEPIINQLEDQFHYLIVLLRKLNNLP